MKHLKKFESFKSSNPREEKVINDVLNWFSKYDDEGDGSKPEIQNLEQAADYLTDMIYAIGDIEAKEEAKELLYQIRNLSRGDIDYTQDI